MCKVNLEKEHWTSIYLKEIYNLKIIKQKNRRCLHCSQYKSLAFQKLYEFCFNFWFLLFLLTNENYMISKEKNRLEYFLTDVIEVFISMILKLCFLNR